ncbi:hypothetical protein, variant [Saprolegnia diclina VS20]|uniref:UFSP1/2/DUB catalytic domain-containing protein n=1 Tax=Saprolegnia diclina (strain VS20) TaxID=1156394 RepID=T0QZZ6_SAPDV|nr:hypothetical protein, variant [Saprolegnia diclina VS20]EQC25303.1 hypothetical protein, variant [Saprolegnia diclina VS20]|eukprot:XP_008621269.1 hypothetical protein, variant [Saprolegnia diclina VS20]
MIAVVPSGLVAAMAQLEEDATTYILGTQDEACIAVWSMSSMRSVSEMLPSGLGTLGVIHVVPTPLDETTLRTQLASKLHDLTTTTYALVYESETKSLRMFPSSSEEPLIPVTVVATPGHCASPFTAAIEYGIVRCFATLDIAWTRDGRDRSMAARSAIDERVAMLSAPEAMYFELPSGDIASRAGDVVHTSSRGKRSAWSLSEIVRPKPRAKKAQRANDGWDDAPKKSQPVASTHVASEDVRYGRVCYMELLTSMTPSTGTAPVITSSFRDHLSITVDVVCCLPTRSPLALVLQTLANRLTDQLCESMKHLQPETQQLRCHQFPLRNGAMHPVAVWSVDGHEVPPSSRDHLHGLFYQPLHPTFLPAGAWSLSRTQPPSDVLLNVHVGISVSKGAGGTQFLVSGDYAFYHYMQQGVNDKGWGCAYRSLQTLASWLVLNHYNPVIHQWYLYTLNRSCFVGSCPDPPRDPRDTGTHWRQTAPLSGLLRLDWVHRSGICARRALRDYFSQPLLCVGRRLGVPSARPRAPF